jgi:hypothetical protein
LQSALDCAREEKLPLGKLPSVFAVWLWMAAALPGGIGVFRAVPLFSNL